MSHNTQEHISDLEPAQDSPDVWEQITYWAVVLVTSAATVALLCGVLGYASVRWVA